MSKTLIIAEKPSQAREYAKTLGVKGKRDGYLENEHYIISWCVGHLLELSSPESYMDLPKVGKRWGIHRLPVLPQVNEFKHTIKTGTKKQYEVLKQLLNSEEVDRVICGTDADREGQLLFQEVWDRLGCRKPLFRLWISSLTQEAIREGMVKLRPFHEVEGLAKAGYGRSYGDWDFGMNLTEGFTALFGSFDPVRKKPNVISIGRVQTPTLALVVEREWAIQNFVPVPYVEIEAEFASPQGIYKGKWFDPTSKKNQDDKYTLDLVRAEGIIAKVQGNYGKVHTVKEKEIAEPHPLLYDLTSLTVAASKRYGFGAEKVLKIAQSLYEKKAITYPRTDCNFLPTDMVPKLEAHLKALKESPYAQWVEEALRLPIPKGKRVINEITAHHAIIPTTERITSNHLTPEELKIWEMIVLRFISIWFPPARYFEKEITTVVVDEYFLSKGKTLLEQGWKKVEKQGKLLGKVGETDQGERDSEDNLAGNLPILCKDEKIQNQSCQAIQKETKPPKRYTQGDLIKAMEGAGREIEDEVLRQQLKGKGLGTVATRGAIIENLLGRGYLDQRQRVLYPTDKGIQLIRLIKESLPQSKLLISAEMTGQMEYELAQVERGEMPLLKFMARIEESVRTIIEELRHFESVHGKKPIANAFQSRNPQGKNKDSKNAEVSRKVSKHDINSEPVTTEALGICPNCGGQIKENTKGYGCENWQKGCKFFLGKHPICGKVLTKTQVKSLLKKGKTPLIRGFKSKTGKSFSAFLVWEQAAVGKLRFEFEK